MTLKVKEKEGAGIPIGFHCSVCSRHQRRKAEDAGKKVRCSECHSWIRVPRKQPASYRPPPGEKLAFVRPFCEEFFLGFVAAFCAVVLFILIGLEVERKRAEGERPAATSAQK